MCTYMCVCTCIHVLVWVCMRIHVWRYAYVYVRTHVHTYVPRYVFMHVWLYVCVNGYWIPHAMIIAHSLAAPRNLPALEALKTREPRVTQVGCCANIILQLPPRSQKTLSNLWGFQVTLRIVIICRARQIREAFSCSWICWCFPLVVVGVFDVFLLL